MIAALVLALAAASPVRVLVLEPKTVNVDVDDARLVQRLVVQELTNAKGLDVIGAADLTALSELEATRQSAGCAGESCLAEVAAALGASLVVFGEVGRLGDDVIWQSSLFDSQSGQVLARHTSRAHAVADLQGDVNAAVRELLAPLKSRGVRAPDAVVNDEGSGLGVVGGIVTGVGAAALVVGVVGVVVGASVVKDPAFDTGLRRNFQDAGPALAVTAVAGGVVTVVGAGLLVAAAFE